MSTVKVGQRWEPIDDCDGAILPIIITKDFGGSVVARWDHVSRLRVGMTKAHIVSNYRRTVNRAHN